MNKKIYEGMETAFINSNNSSNLAFKPHFVSNDEKSGRKVLTTIENELKDCDEFKISVAFITESGVTPLLMILKELEKKNIPGQILTTDYLAFSDPKALMKLNSLKNIELRMYGANEKNHQGFHTKGYMFKKEEIYSLIIGSSNMTLSALTVNKEWNAKLVSTVKGEFAEEILDEFEYLWAESSDISDIIDTYSEIYKSKKDILRQTQIPTIKQYKLEPNKMQLAFIKNLKEIRAKNQNKALLISATGTGKTYASAFALREEKPRKALFLVHREQIAKQAIKSYKDVFGDTVSYGLLSGSHKDYNADYLFSTMQMMSKKDIYSKFNPDEFQIIVVDEVHRAGAESYQRIMEYFKPSLWLGMTASPDRPDGFDIYDLFDHNIAYEIRLQKALESNLLCPFQYFGITDISIDGETFDDESSAKKFSLLVADERVDNIIEQASYYGYSGERVKGLVFCSTKAEAEILSKKFNERYCGDRLYRTVYLSGDDDQRKREGAIERLANEDAESDDFLDYIFTVDIFNEGVDIPEVNQVIMLRPTQSPIVFVQQLGRGLRKREGKEFVVVLDFIGNYTNNFMIPIALFGDRTYNKDNMRRYVIEGNRIMPGSSSIHFDEISKKRIFDSIDTAKPNSIKFLKEEYKNLKNKVGHIPSYRDFEEYGAIDVSLFFENSNLGSYYAFLKKYEDDYCIYFDSLQEELLRFISEKVANGKRFAELDFIERMLQYKKHSGSDIELEKWLERYKSSNAIQVLCNEFASNENNKRKYQNSIFAEEKQGNIQFSEKILAKLDDANFYHEVSELVEYGVRQNKLYYSNKYKETDFVLYQKYTYEDVCKLLNWSRNEVALNIGGYKYDKDTNTFPVFINYNKDENISDSIRYEDRFVDEGTMIALSKQSRTPESKDVQQIYQAKEHGTKIYLFVRKNKDDAVSKEFYFLGEISAVGEPQPVIMRNTDKDAVEITYKLEVPVREDIYDYIVS
ncbi:DEAD/DEAH box helicase [Lachnospiraceae bacterium PAL227]|uniref:DEAD/DEAH box helicase n=2 Tax=Ohessyouella blattaphilus TaxID=2949333 RepID=A0ABT1EKD9_9FIRM|nr:DEAD/DEAH box helicase [Ohessyouella blattaphilus]MCP1111172.1 DEAD/DEAH box helicase [Ohessyouella blattaphilus]MCR8564566.1 DEAD/DEAH box helicase [Ohessyouella blattaphilus]MDL2251070.1 DEAD/DEAH box helicase [Lachnospiraceae bacterium OttesenSCG-928-J05]